MAEKQNVDNNNYLPEPISLSTPCWYATAAAETFFLVASPSEVPQ